MNASGVERPGPGKAPTAFRIWRHGSNVTDHGDTVFDARAAQLLMAEQAMRGNRYSFDYNHASLDPSAPIENQRGGGSFRLEVRKGELWAVDCRFTADAKRGIESGEWTSMSPAYDVETKSRRVVSFMNCALTNNPATFSATQLAASRTSGVRAAPPAKTAEQNQIAVRMGLPSEQASVSYEGKGLVFRPQTPEQARIAATRPLVNRPMTEGQCRIAARMGLAVDGPGVVHERGGRAVVFGVQTAEQARRNRDAKQ